MDFITLKRLAFLEGFLSSRTQLSKDESQEWGRALKIVREILRDNEEAEQLMLESMEASQ